eukprot:scaffold16969_cov72-Cyclotella_meneghiniana.AAC.1
MEAWYLLVFANSIKDGPHVVDLWGLRRCRWVWHFIMIRMQPSKASYWNFLQSSVSPVVGDTV